MNVFKIYVHDCQNVKNYCQDILLIRRFKTSNIVTISDHNIFRTITVCYFKNISISMF